MPSVTITREMFLEEGQGRTFSDVLNDPEQPFDAVLEFFNDDNRQRRMEESEIHHDRPPLAGVVRELESHPAVDRFLAGIHTQRSKRLRQAIGVLVRMIMEARGWRKTGRKGSLGVRASGNSSAPKHNTGGLAFWFIRAERYERAEGMPFRSVRERCQELEAAAPRKSRSGRKKRVVPEAASVSSGKNGEGQRSKLLAKRPKRIARLTRKGSVALSRSKWRTSCDGHYGAIWFQAYMSGADVSLMSLIGMSFRQVKPRLIVTAKIMGRQAGLNIDRQQGMSTARLEAHFLAGGDVMHVLRAIIAAHRAGIDLDFDRAAAVDLAGRDVLDAVRTSVSPKVIDCPEPQRSGKTTLSAVAKNGVELRVRARVTVRTNLDQLIGGATEETIIARVGQGIVTAIGSARTHMEVMEMPDRISKGVLDRGLDANTAFEIVSIDIADIDVGENIGARLQTDQAEADMRMAQAAKDAWRIVVEGFRTSGLRTRRTERRKHGKVPT